MNPATKRGMPWLPFLKTLRKLPDDVVLDMATREYLMEESRSCLCGWALRSELSRLLGTLSPEQIEAQGRPGEMVARFGGTVDEWKALFVGVTKDWGGHVVDEYRHLRGKLPEIERAFVERVVEAASKRRR